MIKRELFFNNLELPEPLSETELYELLKKYENGDFNAEIKLVEHNIKFVINRVLTNFINIEYEKQDLVATGIIGLVKAIKHYDINKKIKFITFATRCVDNEILLFLRHVKKNSNIDSLDRTIYYSNKINENSKLTLGSTLVSDYDLVKDYEKMETHRILREIVENLPTNEKEIIEMYFGFNGSRRYIQRELAENLGISQSNLSKIIKKILKKIRIQLEEVGLFEQHRDNKKIKKIFADSKINGNSYE